MYFSVNSHLTLGLKFSLLQKQYHDPRYWAGSPSFCTNHQELLRPAAHTEKSLFLCHLSSNKMNPHLLEIPTRETLIWQDLSGLFQLQVQVPDFNEPEPKEECVGPHNWKGQARADPRGPPASLGASHRDSGWLPFETGSPHMMPRNRQITEA